VFVAAAGDDVATFCPANQVRRVCEAIADWSSAEKEGQVGLGQCVKEVVVG